MTASVGLALVSTAGSVDQDAMMSVFNYLGGLVQMSSDDDAKTDPQNVAPTMADFAGSPKPPCPPGVDCEGYDNDDYDGYDFSKPEMQDIWNDPAKFSRWVKGQSKGQPLTQTQAQQIVQNARRLDPNQGNMSLRVGINQEGLAGTELRNPYPHFTIGRTHLPVQPGVTLQ